MKNSWFNACNLHNILTSNLNFQIHEIPPGSLVVIDSSNNFIHVIYPFKYWNDTLTLLLPVFLTIGYAESEDCHTGGVIKPILNLGPWKYLVKVKKRQCSILTIRGKPPIVLMWRNVKIVYVCACEKDYSYFGNWCDDYDSLSRKDTKHTLF